MEHFAGLIAAAVFGAIVLACLFLALEQLFTRPRSPR
jgi:hypothetical protein